MRNLAKITFCLWIVWFIFVPVVSAQDEYQYPQKIQISDCTQRLFNRVQKDFSQRPFRNSGYFAEKYSRQIIEVCPNADFDQLKSELRVLEEENAEHTYLIAKYYFDKYQKTGSGLNAALARFIEITEKYSDFSKIDEVLTLLAKTYEYEEDYESAEYTLVKLIKDFPDSPARTDASAMLDQIRTKRMVRDIARPSEHSAQK